MSYQQVKTVSVLALMCLLQTSVSVQGDIIITVRYKENSALTISVIFSEDKFKTFYGCMCSGARNCAAKYSTEQIPNVHVAAVDSSAVQNRTAKPVYQCINSPSQTSLICIPLTKSSLPENYVLAQTFRLNNSDCQSRYVTLFWFYREESLTVNADIPDFEFCEPAFDCASTTKRPETSSASTRTSSLSPESFTLSDKKDEDDGNAGVIAGIAVAVFFIGIGVGIVVVVLMVRWRRRKNQGTKEPGRQSMSSPTPTSLSLSGATPAADPSTNANSLPSETSEASPSEPNSIASTSTPQNDYSQLDVSNTDGHAYAALSPSPYYNSVNEITTESTSIYEQNADTPKNTPAYYNTPDATPNSSFAYSNTQRGPTNIISDQPETETEGAYEEADAAYSPGRGACVNLNKSAQRMTEQNDNTIYCN